MLTLAATAALITIHRGKAVGYRSISDVLTVQVGRPENDAMSASGLGVRASGDIATIVVTVVIVLHAVIVVPSTWLIKRQASIDPADDSFHDLAQKITQNAPHCLSSPLIRHNSRMRKYAQAGPFHPQLARMLYRSLRASGAECKCRNPFRCRSSKGPADNSPAVLLGWPRFPSRHGGISSDRAGSFPILAVPVVDGGGVRGMVEVWERTLWRGVGECMRGAVSP